MSVRQIKKSYISCVGYFKSYKNNKQLAFESILERDFFMMLEFDSSVVSYKEQPLKIKYNLNGVVTRYTPDVLVTYINNQQKIYEVKYQNEIDSDAELQHKLSIVEKEIKCQLSLPFDVFTDTQINPIYFKNCTFLYKYAFLIKSEAIERIINQALKEQQNVITIKDFLYSLSNNQNEQLRFVPYLWHEVFKNTALIKMNQPLTMLSLLQFRR